MADSVEVSTIETTDGTVGVIRDNAARQSIANIREGKETVGSVAWENVKGRPTKVSELENDKNYQTDENVSNTLNSTLYAGSSTHGGPATSADKLATARNITIGSSSKKFDGSSDVSYSLSEIGALGTSDIHDWAKTENKPSYSWNEITGKPSTFTPLSHTHTKDQVGLGNVANIDQSRAIKSITRSGTTFTATALDGTTSTFTQQDVNTTYGLASQSSNGLMSAADKKAVDREFFRMLPNGGTYIPAKADLNSIQYLKIGNYYNPLSVEAATIKNCPAGAFIMYVLSPLSENYDDESTKAWVYRLRIFVEFTGRNIFVQSVNSDATVGSFRYGSWVKMINSNDLGAVSNKVAKYTLTASNWSGTSAPYTYDLGSAYGNNSVIGFDSAVGNATQLEAAMSANIQGSSTTKIYAYGDKPTVDIPIVINYQ